MNEKKATTPKKIQRKATFPKTGAKLSAARERAKVSLRNLAKVTALSYETVRLVERGCSGLKAFRTVVLVGGKTLKFTRHQQLLLLNDYMREIVQARS